MGTEDERKADKLLDELGRAQEILENAQTPESLRAAHDILRHAITRKRRDADPHEGALAQTFTIAMQTWDAQKHDGVSHAERIATMERTLRAAWPQRREWHFICDRCRDTGLVHKICSAGDRCNGTSTRSDHPTLAPGKYQRLCALKPDGDYRHDYAVPCWCEKGKKFDLTMKPTGGDGDDFKKATQMTRFGR